MMFKTLSLGAATAALLATGALAQTAQPTEPATPPAVTQPAPSGAASTTTTATKTTSINFKSLMAADEMRASKLSGLQVRNAAGENLGDINEIVMDHTGKPTTAVIGVGGFLGLGEKNVGVPFDALTFAPASDGTNMVRLDATSDALKAAPTYAYKEVTAATKTNDVDTTGALGTKSPATPRPAQ